MSSTDLRVQLLLEAAHDLDALLEQLAAEVLHVEAARVAGVELVEREAFAVVDAEVTGELLEAFRQLERHKA
jgi:hypothetical protein